jgi:hypothetical protein
MAPIHISTIASPERIRAAAIVRRVLLRGVLSDIVVVNRCVLVAAMVFLLLWLGEGVVWHPYESQMVLLHLSMSETPDAEKKMRKTFCLLLGVKSYGKTPP